METIYYREIMEQGTHPIRGTAGSAGWDFLAAEDKILKPMIPTLVSTGLEIAIPENHMLLVLPRSGNALKKNVIIPNSPGLIDEDYRGELKVILTWLPDPSPKPQSEWQLKIVRGDRIAQGILIPYKVQNWVPATTLPPTARGAGGFGSTG